MKGAILLSFVAFCALVNLSSGTGCEKTKACVKSLYATGACTNNVCVCVSNYFAGPYGCQEKKKATITTTPAGFNGQGKDAGKLEMHCTDAATESSPIYKWFKDGTALNPTTKTHTLTNLGNSNDGKYTCQSPLGGVLSSASDGVNLAVTSSPNTKPSVVGMPTAAIKDMVVTLTCSSPPAASNDMAFVWKNAGTAVPGQTGQTYNIKLITSDVGKAISCSQGGVESETVTLPTHSADITGVQIVAISATTLMEDETLKLQCQLTGDFPSVPETPIVTFKWLKDAVEVIGSTDQILEITSIAAAKAGVYTCTGMVPTKAVKTSEGVPVTVKKSMAQQSIGTSTKCIKGGNCALTCNYKIVDTSTAVSFTWYKDNKVIPGVKDKTIQLNPTADEVNGDYTCSVTSTDGTVTNNKKTITAEAFSESDVPIVTVYAVVFGVGNTYSFMCESDYYTLGATYEWHVGSTKQSEVSDTFSYKVTSTTTTDIKCKILFNSLSSQERTISITGKYILSADVVYDVGVAVVDPKPVKGSKLKFSCKVVTSANSAAVTYVWKKDNADVGTAKSYEMDVPTATTPIKIKCVAKVGSEISETSEITVTPQDNAEKPTITATSTTPKIDADEVLICKSASYAVGAMFSWTKGGQAISETSYQLKLSSIQAASNGEYKCKIKIGSATSVESNGVTITTKANEQTCVYANDCSLPNFDDSVCTSGKCKCKSGYTLKGGLCTSGAAAVLGSVLVMLAAVLVPRLF